MAVIEDLPVFADAEFDDRIERVRGEMARLDLEGLVVATPETIFYLTGLDHQGFFALHLLIVPREGRLTLIARAMEGVTVRDQVRNAGFIEGVDRVTLYTTLSPCMMCTGAMLFLGIPRVVIGDRETYPGDVEFLLARGMQVALADDPDCIRLMRRFIAEQPELWSRITAGERG